MADTNGFSGYLEYLRRELGYQITIKDFVGFIPKNPAVAAVFGPGYIHRSAFCMTVKSQPDLWDRCQQNTVRLRQKCGSCRYSFVGRCYCGICEVVVPVCFEDQAIATIGIGGFETDPAEAGRRIERTASQFGLDRARLQEQYLAGITVQNTDIETIKMHGQVIAEYLLLHYQLLIARGTVIPHKIYVEDASRLYILTNAIEYIRQHFAEDIRVADVARFCQCSESYINHMFKRQMERNFSLYVNEVRIEEARRLLADSGLRLAVIAQRCGFADPNYFSNVFRRVTGLSPTIYRQQILADSES